MIEAGILDGDLVIVQSAQDARNGEIVVALAGEDESTDEATVKTFYRERERIRLQPENAALEPIYAPHVQILGRVVGSVPGALDDVGLSRRCIARSTRSSSRSCAAPRSNASPAASSSCTRAAAVVFCPECGASSPTRARSRSELESSLQAG